MTSAVADLQACLETETRLTAEFLDILRDEARVLEEGGAETALAENTARKDTAADSLARASEKRNALLGALGYEHDAAGLQAAAEDHPLLAESRRKLLDAAEQARSLNAANGRVIEIFLDHNQRTLDTLRRLAGVGDIYDASGRTRPGNKGSGRNIKAG